MKHAAIVRRKELERALESNPNSEDIKRELRVITITINWL